MSFYTNVTSHRNYIYIRAFDENGERVSRRVHYSPTLYHSSTAKTGYTDIYGNSVQSRNFDSMWEARDWIRKNSDITGFTAYGLTRFPYTFIYENYHNCVPDTSKINVVSIDIEVLSNEGFPQPSEARFPVVSIALQRGNLKICLGLEDYENDDKNTYYIKCKDEAALLRKFIKTFRNLDADILTGWNTEYFDIPYLINRCYQVIGEKATSMLSPWEIIEPD